MGLLQRTSFARGWMPDADVISAPSDALLRMDNCVLDELGAVALRKGSAKLNASPFVNTDVHSLYTTVLNGTRVRLAAANAQVYANGLSLGQSLAGDGDVSFGATQGHVFWTRSTSKQSYDGSTVRQWGLPMTGAAPVPQATTVGGSPWVLASCTSSDNFSEDKGTRTYETGHDSVANGAMKLTADAATGLAQATKTFASDQDTMLFTTGVEGTPEDVFETWLYVTDPAAFTSLTVMIDINSESPTSFLDYYAYEFNKKGQDVVARRLARRLRGPGWRGRYDRSKGMETDPPEPDAGDLGGTSPEDDLALVAEGWTKLSIRRSDFLRYGSTAGCDWSTVKRLRLVVKMAAGGTTSIVRVDAIQFIGDVLLGTYTYRYVLGRTATSYTALSGPSDPSDELLFEGHSATVQIPPDVRRVETASVVWVYRQGEELDTYYRVATQTLVNLPFAMTAAWEAAEIRQGVMLEGGCSNYTCADETSFAMATFTYYGVSNHTSQAEEADGWLASVGASRTLKMSTGGIAVSDRMTDRDTLIVDLPLQIDNTPPPDQTIGIAGPYYDRLFCLTTTTLSPSRVLNPESFSTGQGITVGSTEETAYWVIQGLGGLYVGTSRDIYRIDGTLAELPDGTIEVQKVPLNIDHPPISATVTKDGPLVVYLAHDGWRALSGVSSTLLVGPTSLLYRGYTRHGISPVNLSTGRVRVAITKGQLVAIVPEGASTISSSVLYRYAFALQRWYRQTYPVAWRSVAREPDGTLIAGDTAGTVWALDSGTTDGQTLIPVTVWTRAEDDGHTFSPKESADLQLNLDTGGAVLAVNVHLDTSATSSRASTAVSTGRGTKDIALTGLAQWRQLQLRLTGDVSTFVLGAYAITYHLVPLGVTAWDSGPMDLGTGELVWVRQVRIKARAGADLTITPYFDGVLWPAMTATATHPNIPTVLEATCGRTTTQGAYKGRVVRLIVTSSSPFFPFWVEVVRRTTAAQTDKKPIRFVAAVGGEQTV